MYRYAKIIFTLSIGWQVLVGQNMLFHHLAKLTHHMKKIWGTAEVVKRRVTDRRSILLFFSGASAEKLNGKNTLSSSNIIIARAFRVLRAPLPPPPRASIRAASVVLCYCHGLLVSNISQYYSSTSIGVVHRGSSRGLDKVVESSYYEQRLRTTLLPLRPTTRNESEGTRRLLCPTAHRSFFRFRDRIYRGLVAKCRSHQLPAARW